MPTDPQALIETLQADACNFAANPAALGDSFDKAVAALKAVLDLHQPFHIYDECGHDHNGDDVAAGRAFDVDDVGYTCLEGFQYEICRHCCTDDSGYQTEACLYHDHSEGICATVRKITDALTGGTDE